MKLIRCAAMAGVMALSANAVYADDWGTTQQIAYNGIAVNMTSLKRDGNDAIFWEVVVLNRPSSAFSYTMQRIQIDCKADTIDILSVSQYASNGDVVQSSNVPSGSESIRPESMGAGERYRVQQRSC